MDSYPTTTGYLNRKPPDSPIDVLRTLAVVAEAGLHPFYGRPACPLLTEKQRIGRIRHWNIGVFLFREQSSGLRGLPAAAGVEEGLERMLVHRSAVELVIQAPAKLNLFFEVLASATMATMRSRR